MFQKHSLTGRIATAKTIGFVMGGVIFFLMLALGATYGTMFGLGLWLFYMLMSITIGFIGLFNQHPIFNFRMHWWMRGAVIGVAYHLMLVLIAYTEISSMFTLPAFAWTGLASPFWILLDGAILGIITAGLTTKYIGEGEMPLK